MRKIYEVAKAELQTLFYSPIAWLIIIVFIFQVSLLFTSALELRVTQMLLGYRTNVDASHICQSVGRAFIRGTELSLSVYSFINDGIDESRVE